MIGTILKILCCFIAAISFYVIFSSRDEMEISRTLSPDGTADAVLTVRKSEFMLSNDIYILHIAPAGQETKKSTQMLFYERANRINISWKDAHTVHLYYDTIRAYRYHSDKKIKINNSEILYKLNIIQD